MNVEEANFLDDVPPNSPYAFREDRFIPKEVEEDRAHFSEWGKGAVSFEVAAQKLIRYSMFILKLKGPQVRKRFNNFVTGCKMYVAESGQRICADTDAPTRDQIELHEQPRDMLAAKQETVEDDSLYKNDAELADKRNVSVGKLKILQAMTSNRMSDTVVIEIES